MKNQQKSKKDIIDILSNNEFKQIFVWLNEKQDTLKITKSKFERNIMEYWFLVGETNPPNGYKYYGDLFLDQQTETKLDIPPKENRKQRRKRLGISK